MNYRKRIVDEALAFKLCAKGAVVIEGPKWCGKTTTAKQQAKSILKMDAPQSRRRNIELSLLDPSLLLNGETPRLIDEWQLAPALWDSIRYEVDERGKMGQFILTGSTSANVTDEITHSGTGRFSWLKMRTMSLYESGESSGEVSLKSLFDGNGVVRGTNALGFEDIAFLTCRGGWPQSLDLKEEIALSQAYDYLDAVVKSDISQVDGIAKSEERAKKILRSYARNIGTQASFSAIKSDIAPGEINSLADNTLASYINALKKIFVIENMPAWSPNLRSKTAIRSADTLYFVDPSIAVAALGASPKEMENDLNLFGFLFECLCVRDLRVYAESLGGSVFHYRDKTGLECDAVIALRNGDYGLVEIKLGGDAGINAAIASLNKLNSKLDTSKMKSPSFLMVLTGVGNYAFRNEQGVYIVPIGCLKN